MHPGYDNSAPQQKGLVLWDKNSKYPAQTLAVVTQMAQKFSGYSSLLGFNLLDSPDGVVRFCDEQGSSGYVGCHGLQMPHVTRRWVHSKQVPWRKHLVQHCRLAHVLNLSSAHDMLLC